MNKKELIEDLKITALISVILAAGTFVLKVWVAVLYRLMELGLL